MMKNNFKETNPLPLTFKYLETLKKKKSAKSSNKEEVIYFIGCEQYDTSFYVREIPVKNLVRLV